MKGLPAGNPVEHDSGIELVDAMGRSFPVAPSRSVLLSSVRLGWRGIIVESHRREPNELPEHFVPAHGVAVSTGKRPISFAWKDGKRWRESPFKPGDFHLIKRGELNTPRWLQTFEAISLVLDPRFVADLVKEGLPADRVEFAAQRSAHDATVTRYAEAFRCELESDGPHGLLYADTLTVGFALHLLSRYGVAKPKIPRPRGKLNSFQLRTVVDFIQSQLSDDVSLPALAEQANVSPFILPASFARPWA